MTTKISSANIQAATLATIGSGPKVTQILVCDQTYTVLDDTAVSLTGGYIKIVGTGFKSGATVTVNRQQATSVTFVDSTELRAQLPAEAAGTYIIYVVNTDGSVALRVNGVTFSSLPTWTTASSLADGDSGSLISLQLLAADAATYALAAGSTLPLGLTLSSSGLLSGTVEVADETLYNFTVVATDAELQDSPRSFSINITVGDPYFNSTALLLTGRANTFVKDASTNNFPVTVVGDTKPSNFNPHLTGWSNYFDGTGDSLIVTGNTSLSLGTENFTIEIWMYGTNIAGTAALIDTRTPDIQNASFDLITIGSKLAFGGALAFFIQGTTTLIGNTWNHVAVTRSGNTFKMFLNGAQEGPTYTGSSTQNFTNNNFKIAAGTNGAFSGYLSNFRVVKGTAVYTSNFTPPTAPLTAITGTSLLTCQSNSFVDNSNNNFSITKNGDVAVRSFSPFVEPVSTSGSTYFDGTNDALSYTSSTTLNFGTADFTVESWINLADTSTSRIIIAGSASNSFGFRYGTTYSGTAGLSVFREAVVDLESCSFTFNTNTWYHVAVVRQSGGIYFYINGIQQTTNGSGAGSYDYSNEVAVNIGSGASGLEDFYGYISDLRVVKGTAVYASNFTPPTQPLTAVSGTSLLTLQTNQPVNNNTFLDSSSVNSLITRTGNTTQGSFSPYSPSGWSMFNPDATGGLGSPSSSQLNMGTGDFTVEAWVNTSKLPTTNTFQTSSGGFQTIFGTGPNNSGSGSQMYIGTTNLKFDISSDGTGPIDVVHNMNAGLWYHIAVSRSGNTFKAFINGTLVQTATSSSSWQDGYDWGIMRAEPLSGWGGAWWYGYISNLRVVKGIAVYTSNFTPSTQPLTTIAGTSLLTCADNRFVDKSVNNFAVTSTGDIRVANWSPFAAQVQTPASYSAYFNGTNSSLTVPASTAFQLTGDFTVEAWIYPTALSSSANMIIASEAGSTTDWFGVIPTQLQIVISNSATNWNYAFSTNTWYHVAVARSGTNLTAYVNGVSIGTQTRSEQFLNTGFGVMVGRYGFSAAYWFTGYLSNVRVVKGTAVYTANFTPPTQPLTAITGTSLLTCQSATFADNSANRFAITAAGNSRPATVNPFGSAFVKSSGYSAAEHSGSMYFDGTGDYLSGSFISHRTSQLTVEAWVYITNRSVARCVFTSRSGNTTDGFQVLVDSGGEVRVGYAGTNFLNTTAATVVAGQWCHIAVTRNSANLMTVWVNGTAATTSTVTANFSSTVFRAGITAENGSPMLGYISDLRVITGSSLYSSNFVPPQTPVLPVANTTLLLNGTCAAIADATTKNDVETVGDAKISTAVSKFGGSSMYFDGSGDYLTAPTNPNYAFGTGDFTIEAWIYRTDTGVQRVIIDTRGGSNVGALFYITTNNKLNLFDSSSVWISSTNTIPVNQWVHVVAARSNAVTKLFINGNQEASAADSRIYVNAAGGLLIGRQFGSTTNDFIGYLQDVRITKGVARYTTSFTPPTNALRLK